MPETDDLPAPLTPPDCDLRGLPYMPLDIIRLLDSDLYALTTGDEFKAAVTLWCRAFLQVPAASLPDDDRILAHLSGAGKRWPKVRKAALHGFVKCSDGRLYHPLISQKSREIFSKRVQQRERAAARWKPASACNPTDEPMPRHSHGNATAMQGRDKGDIREEDTPPLCPPLPDPAPPKAATARRGSRLAETTLPDDWHAWAEAAGHHDPPAEWARFADYWRSVPGQKGSKLDWPATWRNWIRKSLDDQRSRPSLIGHVAQPSRSTDAWFRVAGRMGGRIAH